MSADSNDNDKKRKGQEEREYVWETLRAIKGAGDCVSPASLLSTTVLHYRDVCCPASLLVDALRTAGTAV